MIDGGMNRLDRCEYDYSPIIVLSGHAMKGKICTHRVCMYPAPPHSHVVGDVVAVLLGVVACTECAPDHA